MNSQLVVIGLTCNLIGVFFLANSIVFRRRRRVIAEFFGVGGGSLNSIKDYALNKMQVVLGFLFLCVGFLFQIPPWWDTIGGAVVDPEKVASAQLVTFSICVGLVGLAAALYFIGAYSSRRSFRRLLQEFFQEHAWSFSDNMQLTKEIGLFLGVPLTEDMTVEQYVHKVRQELNVADKPQGEQPVSSRTRRIRSISPLPGR